jgi:phosphohistidine phosphatase SixA/8-oxo-dGTP pyrophosphatase MutT (NUDIX family)
MASERIINAAGGVVWRKRAGSGRAEPRVDVLVVHRPSYDDWTFPKGKVDPGEALQATAVREIAEETSLRVRLGPPLVQVSYPIAAGTKVVDYWSARAIGQDAMEPFTPNKEVDELRWVGVREARELLTYKHDIQVLEDFRGLREQQGHRARTLIVVRHGKAAPRGDYDDDLERPLTAVGVEQARALVPLLSAYGVRRVVSSPAVRCAQTVEPYAHSISTFLEIDDRLSEDTRAAQVDRSITALLDRKKPVALCSHRPTLPWIFDAIGTDVRELATGEAVVVHHRKGKVIATEKLP